MQLTASMISGLESAINRYLRLDPDTCVRMAALTGCCIGIELRGLDMTLFVFPGEHGIRIEGQFEGEPDTILRGTPLGMARLGLGSSTEKTLFSGDVAIDGNVETGQAFKSILDEIDIDWEDQLSKLTGDVIAHQLGNAARHARKILRHGRSTLLKDADEYLHEELRVLPARIETDNFSVEVSRITMDTDRLAARIKRLQSSPDNDAVS